MTASERREEEPNRFGEDAPGSVTGLGFEYTCPLCGLGLERYAETCPRCGADLEELFSATYRMPASPVVRNIALAMLIGLVLLVLLTLAVLLHRVPTSPPTGSGVARPVSHVTTS